jgi:hypothetical protein
MFLPNEILSEIFRHLSIFDLFRFQRVNSLWRSMCTYHITKFHQIRIGQMVQTTKTLKLTDWDTGKTSTIKILVCQDSNLGYEKFYHLWDFLFDLENSYSTSVFCGSHSLDDITAYYQISSFKREINWNDPKRLHFKGIRYFLGNSGMCATYDSEKDTYVCFRVSCS